MSAKDDVPRKANAASGLRRGQVLTTTIESLEPNGCGVSRDLGLPIFINRTAPGDSVEIELFDVRKSFARGRLLRVLEPSVQRVDPPCKLFKVCGGCQWQHLDYTAQLQAKKDIVGQAIKHIGGLDSSLVKDVVAAKQPLFYRNKVQFPVAHPRDSSRILAGYYQQDSHQLVNIKHCPVQPEPLDRMLAAVKGAAAEHGLTAYDEETRQGLLRHITARFSFDSKKVLVVLVLNTSKQQLQLPKLTYLAEDIMAEVPEISGVCVNLNTAAGNRIFGEETICLSGEPYIREKLCSTRDSRPQQLRQGLEFQLSATSFFQVNSLQAVELLELILDAVLDTDGKPIPLIADAYAGVGTIALWLAPVAEKVLAIEEYAGAVADGQINMQLNAVHNVEFHQGRVEEVLSQWVKQGIKPDVMVLDPPRKGVSAEALEEIIKLNVARLIYVSCNPATLARDLKVLQQNGYKTKEIQPLDMFPQTYHVESVTILEKIGV